MNQTLRFSLLKPVFTATAVLSLAFASGCTEQQSLRSGGNGESQSSDQNNPSPGSTTRPGSENPTGPGGSTAPAPVAIPASVAADNPANRPQDPSSLPLTSLASAKLEQRLADGLSLERKEMCKELGQFRCFEGVFNAPLGNSRPQSRVNSPRPSNPPALAPIAIERIARQVCRVRKQKDAALGDKAEVFKFFDLGSAKPSVEAVSEQTKLLYQNLLGRQPSGEELAIAKTVNQHGLSGGEVAEILCFAVAGSMEILFN